MGCFMKKIVVLIIALYALFIPNVNAHEMLVNGWHIIPTSDAKASDSWDNQNKVWALYVNGVETKRYSTFVGVHRGWGDAPENSLASFKSVKDHGYYGFETDVRFTKDNVAVLCHDVYINNLAVTNDLKALSGDKIYVKNLTYAQLKNNYIFNIQRLNEDPDKQLSNYNSNRITTFEEMLDFAKANNMQVSIELKEGSQEQIASIVKMAEQKNMYNNVRWISYYVQLLEYVKNTDADEKIGVLIGDSGKCDGNNNRYCNGDGTSKAESIYKRLKTTNNMVWFGSYTDKYKLPGTNFGQNMPSNKTKVDQAIASYTLKTIPQGKISFSTTSIKADVNETKEITYNYDGDGTVKCLSSNTNVVTCNVDSNKKRILVNIKNSGANSVDLNVYASQGIAYSATNDNKITVTINKQSEPVVTSIVKNINVSGYNLGFNENNHNYKLKINNENRLSITCDIDSNYKYIIKNNDNLKNGNVIQIEIIDNKNTVVSTYNIEIEKDTSINNRTVSPVESNNNTNNSTNTNTNTNNTISNNTTNVTSTNNNSVQNTTSNTTVTTARAVSVGNANNTNTTTNTNNNNNATVVSVPNTDQYISMIYYMIALSLLLLAYEIIKKNRKYIRIK